ncbi:hypothetical protein L6452_31486 [Arctium lappa]|uniref:Uncharacterized protein n=1 Tax=Arctium lappa TaxID=4217 RepID=A0ACB8Z1Z8_ARCLA|nr:hypothetical protein L6452_31486 [Arctium lappa]
MMAFIIVHIVVPQEEPHLGLITKRNKLECSLHLFITSVCSCFEPKSERASSVERRAQSVERRAQSVERRAEIDERRVTCGDEQSRIN